MKRMYDEDELNRRIATRANFYIIQYVWHDIKGARPKDFKLYDALGIKRTRYANIIKHGNPEFSDSKYMFLYSKTGLPSQVFKGLELIDVGITLDEWKTLFSEYDLYLDNEKNEYLAKKADIDEKLEKRCNDSSNVEGFYKILVDWFNGAPRTDISPDEYMTKLQTILNYITVYDLEDCSLEVLAQTIKSMNDKYQLMKAVELCKKAKAKK